jgi:hypothetical protein
MDFCQHIFCGNIIHHVLSDYGRIDSQLQIESMVGRYIIILRRFTCYDFQYTLCRPAGLQTIYAPDPSIQNAGLSCPVLPDSILFPANFLSIQNAGLYCIVLPDCKLSMHLNPAFKMQGYIVSSCRTQYYSLLTSSALKCWAILCRPTGLQTIYAPEPSIQNAGLRLYRPAGLNIIPCQPPQHSKCWAILSRPAGLNKNYAI